MTKTETYIAFIIGQLRKGNVMPERIVSLFVRKFQVTDRTFYRHWKIANERYSKEIQDIESKKADIASMEAESAAKRDIMDKNERLEILTKMARGVARKVGGQLLVPSDGDRRAAIDLINKMDGIYITKVAQTDSSGNDVGFTINSADQLREFLKGKK